MPYGLSGSTGPYGNEIVAMVTQIKADASNVIQGINPAYTSSDLLAIFPQFGITKTVGVITTTVIPSTMMSLYIAMATASLVQLRWKSKWSYAMALYIAHFCTLYMQTQAGTNKTAAQVVGTSEAKFPKQSKGVGDVSASYDTSSISGDLPGWAMWKSTTYGMQLATLAKSLPSAKAGMYVW
jgi:hypothetical protein